MASEDDLELDFVVDLGGLDEPDSTRIVSMTGTSAAVYVFEPEGDHATEALKRSGLKVQRCTMGSEVMAAAKRRDLLAVLVSPTTDPELRELFMRAFHSRFARVPVVFITTKFADQKELAQFRHEGAADVLPWPLPAPGRIVEVLQRYIQRPVEVLGADPLSAEQERADIALLSRKVEALEGRAHEDSEPALKAAHQQAQLAAEKRHREATALRSELTLVRERSQVLQDRIDRLAQDLAVMTRERDTMKLKIEKLEEDPDPGKPAGDALKALRKIGQSADSFVWGLEQAIQFFEDLQFEVGDERAPSLKGHVRSMKLTRALLERIRDRLNQL
jgi:CheY-like chemotaxis protein